MQSPIHSNKSKKIEGETQIDNGEVEGERRAKFTILSILVREEKARKQRILENTRNRQDM